MTLLDLLVPGIVDPFGPIQPAKQFISDSRLHSKATAPTWTSTSPRAGVELGCKRAPSWTDGIHPERTTNQPTHGTVTTLAIVESTIAAETWSASAA